MKFIYGFLIFLLILPHTLSAADDFHYFSVGPYFSLKTGVNGGHVMDGRKNGLAFNGIPDFGATCFYPLGEETDLGMTFDLGLSTYAFVIKGVVGDEVFSEYTNKFSYLAFAPNLHFDGFMAGFNFGYPLFANFGDKIDANKLNMMVEFRLAYLYPVMMDDDGTLNVFAQAGYMFTGIYDNYEEDDPLLEAIPPIPEGDEPSNKYNPRAISLSIGLTYLFNLAI